METGPSEPDTSAHPTAIRVEVIGFSCKSFDENLKDLVKHLFIFNSAMYITKDFSQSRLSSEGPLCDEAFLERSQLVLDKIAFSEVNKLSFGKLEKFIERNQFPIKITTNDSKDYYIELTKADYFYMRKIFGENSQRRKSSRSKKFPFTQNTRDRLVQMDASPFVWSLFELIVIDHQLMREDQFHRILFDRPELNILVERKSKEEAGGFRYLADRVGKQFKSGKFRVDYVVPDLWKDERKMLLVDEEEQDLLQTVAVPQLDKVGRMAK